MHNTVLSRNARGHHTAGRCCFHQQRVILVQATRRRERVPRGRDGGVPVRRLLVHQPARREGRTVLTGTIEPSRTLRQSSMKDGRPRINTPRHRK